MQTVQELSNNVILAQSYQFFRCQISKEEVQVNIIQITCTSYKTEEAQLDFSYMGQRKDPIEIDGIPFWNSLFNQNNKTLNVNHQNLGQTKFATIYQIDCGLMIGINNHPESSQYPVTGILLHSNGSPLIYPHSIAKIITKQMNIRSKEDIYWYNSPKGHLTLIFQVKKSQIFPQYMQRKVAQINQELINILYLLGILNTNQFVFNCRPKKQFPRKSLIAHWKVSVLMSCLENKSNIANVMGECDQRRKNLKEKIKNIGKGKQQTDDVVIDIEQILPTDRILEQSPCSFLSSIQKKQQMEELNKSQKFNLEKALYTIQLNQPKQQKTMVLLKKTIKQNLKQGMHYKAGAKLLRQIQIIKKIKYGRQYFPRYFLLSTDTADGTTLQNTNNSQRNQGILNQLHYVNSSKLNQIQLYVEYMPSNLAFYLANDIFDFKGFLNRFREIVDGVQALHMSGIVHRDLKPQNIMINQYTPTKVKIIDFSDSAFIDGPQKSQISNNYGCSLPYSPFECAFSCQHGINSPAIDIWSLGILLHEFYYKQIPCLYVNNTTLEQFIEEMSNNRLNIVITNIWYKKGFLGFMEEFVQLLIRNCLILIHYQRIGIDLVKKIVGCLARIVEDMEDVIQSSRVDDEQEEDMQDQQIKYTTKKQEDNDVRR